MFQFFYLIFISTIIHFKSYSQFHHSEVNFDHYIFFQLKIIDNEFNIVYNFFFLSFFFFCPCHMACGILVTSEKVKLKSLSHVWLFATPWTVAYQAPLSMGFFQARILEWVAISFSRRSFQPRDWTRVSRIAGRCFTIRTTRLASRPGIKTMPPALGTGSLISNSLVKSFSIFLNFYWDSYRLIYKCKK